MVIKNFRGIDKESFLSNTTKAYMAILGDGRGGIFCENSLEAVAHWSVKAQNAIGMDDFNVVLTNSFFSNGVICLFFVGGGRFL